MAWSLLCQGEWPVRPIEHNPDGASVEPMEDPMSKTKHAVELAEEGATEVLEQVQEAVHQGVGAARQALSQGVEELDRRYRETVTQVRGGAHRFSEQAKGQLAEVRDTVRERYSQARDGLVRLDRNTREYVNGNPGKSMLIAAGLGIVVGFLLSRRSRHS